MSKLRGVLSNQRGFMLLNVIFLTLITSFAAVILINAASRVRNPQASLRLTAFHIANEQFAQLESRAAAGATISGGKTFLGDKDDLISQNFSKDTPTTFDVETKIGQVSGSPTLRTATVTVTWKVGEKTFELVAERTIRLVQ